MQTEIRLRTWLPAMFYHIFPSVPQKYVDGYTTDVAWHGTVEIASEYTDMDCTTGAVLSIVLRHGNTTTTRYGE